MSGPAGWDPRAVVLQLVLGVEGARHVARCVAWAEEHAHRHDGISVPRSVAFARSLLALAAALPAPQAEANGRAEVPLEVDLAASTPTEWITTVEVASMLDCTSRNARDLCERGALATARRRGGRWAVDRLEVAERAALGRRRAA